MRNVTVLNGRLRVNCHPYGTKTGLDVVTTVVHDAWENGVHTVTVRHNQGVHPPNVSRGTDGTFLWHLEQELPGSRFAAYVEDFHVSQTEVTIDVKGNPEPLSEPVWSDLPEPEMAEPQPMRTRGVTTRPSNQW